MTITIQDDGKGFIKEGIRSFSNRLYNIEKRMKNIGRASEITSNSGATVRLVAPF